MRPELRLLLAGAAASVAPAPAPADIALTGAGSAIVSNGPREKDFSKWEVGGLDGWSGCLLVGLDQRTGEELCGCLGRQRAFAGPSSVEIGLDGVKACSALFIAGAWNSSWGQYAAARAPVVLEYDPSRKTISGCWMEAGGGGKITGVIMDGVFDAHERSLSFSYDDFLRRTAGKATFSLSSGAQALTLLGSWSQLGASGSWTMMRDPVGKPFGCSGERSEGWRAPVG